MDATGAEFLRQRLAQQEQWREARLVRLGRQPSFDPDGYALESFAPGVRFYRAQRRIEQREGRRATVVERMRKRLVDGAWESEVLVEAVHVA
jgi:hypothetical protein